MQKKEREIIQQFTVKLKQDVIPVDVLPHLSCLTEDDCEQIQSKQNQEGPRAAVPILLDKLKRREGAFQQFLEALKETGCKHLNTLLQNAMQDQPCDSKCESEPTQETKSNLQSKPHRMSTTETDGTITNCCPPLQLLTISNQPNQPCYSKCETEPMQETKSNLQSKPRKMPTTETDATITNSCPQEIKKPSLQSNPGTPKKPIQSISSKTSKKRPKLKNYGKPKKSPTSQPKLKANTLVETEAEISQPVQNESSNSLCVKLFIVKTDTTSTFSKKSTASMEVSKSASPTKTNKKPGKQTSSSSPNCAKSCKKNNPTNYVLTNSMSSRLAKANPDKESKTRYDTIICYAKENQEIALELTEYLETKCNIQVCIDLVNFIPGKATADNISESINSSKSIIFLLSPEFPRKLWASWELKQAVYTFNESQKSGKAKKVIPVLLKDCQVPEELKIYTPIKVSDFESRKQCWERLAFTISGIPYAEEAVADDLVAADAISNYNTDDCVSNEGIDVIDNQDGNVINFIVDDGCNDDAHNRDADSINVKNLARENAEAVACSNDDNNQDNHDNKDENDNTNDNDDNDDDDDNHDDNDNYDDDNDHGSEGNILDDNDGNIDNSLVNDDHHTCVSDDDDDDENDDDENDDDDDDDDNDDDKDNDDDDDKDNDDGNDNVHGSDNNGGNADEIDGNIAKSLVDDNHHTCVDGESDLVDSNNTDADDVAFNCDNNGQNSAESENVKNNASKGNSRYGDIDSL